MGQTREANRGPAVDMAAPSDEGARSAKNEPSIESPPPALVSARPRGRPRPRAAFCVAVPIDFVEPFSLPRPPLHLMGSRLADS
eukprot:3378962-Pyramimonas_sp.AAC.1